MKNDMTLPLPQNSIVVSVDHLDARNYIEVLKNYIEVPKYLAGFIVFLATATAAISRIGLVSSGDIGSGAGEQDGSTVGRLSDLQGVLIILAVVSTIISLYLGYRLVAHLLREMALVSDQIKEQRTDRFLALRRGPYSLFVKSALFPICFWFLSLLAIIRV